VVGWESAKLSDGGGVGGHGRRAPPPGAEVPPLRGRAAWAAL